MTLFTNDTCYNLAVVTVLALLLLFLINKVFFKEDFAVYDQWNMPDYAKCAAKEGNETAVAFRKKICRDLNNPVTDNPVPNDCLLRGGNIVKNSICYLYSDLENRNKLYSERYDPINYNDCLLKGGQNRLDETCEGTTLPPIPRVCKNKDILVGMGIKKCCDPNYPFLNDDYTWCCQEQNKQNMCADDSPRIKTYNPELQPTHVPQVCKNKDILVQNGTIKKCCDPNYPFINDDGAWCCQEQNKCGKKSPRIKTYNPELQPAPVPVI